MDKEERRQRALQLLLHLREMEVAVGRFRQELHRWWDHREAGYEAVADIDTLPLSVSTKEKFDDFEADARPIFEDINEQLSETLNENK